MKIRLLITFINILFLSALSANTNSYNEEISVQLKWKHQFQFAGFYAALEKGFYEEEGLKVNLVEGKSGVDFVKEVISGRSQYGLEMPSLLISRSLGLPVVSLAPIFQHSPYILLVDKQLNIDNIKKLKGKTIMLRKDSASEIVAMLKKTEVFDSLEIIEHTWYFEHIITKYVAAAGAYLTDNSYLKEGSEDSFSYLNPINYGIDFYGDCIFTSEYEIKNNPDRVEKFLNATKKGWRYAFDNVDEIIDLIIKKYDGKASRKNLMYEAEKMRSLILPNLVPIGQQNKERWQHILNVYKTYGMIDKDFNLDGFLYEEYTDKKSKLIRIIFITIGSIVLIVMSFLIFLFYHRRKIKEAKDKIYSAEYKYRLLFSKSNDAIFRVNKINGRIESVNNFAEILTGIESENLLNQKIYDVDILPKNKFFKLVSNISDNIVISNKEFINRKNERKTINLTIIAIDEKDLFIEVHDITELKKSTEALLASESKSNALLAAMPDMIFRLDRSGIYLDYKAEKEKLYAYDVDTIIGKNYKDLVPEDVAKLFESKIEAVFEKGEMQTFEYRLARDHYESTDFEARIVRSGKNEVLAIVRDITEKVKHQEILKAQQQKFKTFFSSVNDSILIHPWKEEGFDHFIEVNNIACQRYGYTRDEFLKISAVDITLKTDVVKHSQRNVRMDLATAQNKIFETIHITKSGEHFPVEISSNIVEQFGQKVIIAVVRDISERKKAEATLKESEEKFRTLFFNNKSIMLLIDPDNQDIVDANNAAVEFYGYSREKLLSLKVNDLNTMPESEIQKEIDLCKRTKKNYFNFTHRKASGELRFVEIYSSSINQGNKVLLYSIIHDVTAQKEAEKAIVESQKLSAIGEMSTAVAHDFNNSLQSIFGNIELALLTESLSPKIKEYLETIRVSAEDASARVSLLQRFGGKKQNESEYVNLDLNQVIKDVINQARPIWKDKTEFNEKNIDIFSELNEIPLIKGNEAELRTVFYNLLKNSIEAMPDGGTIIFETSLENDKVKCTITDNGIGMDEETKNKALEPFFTTKGYNIGRGLGLCGAYGIINEHNSDFEIIETSPGKGCKIAVTIPAVFTEKATELYKSENPKGSLNILWVDDEEILRESGLEFLDVLDQNGIGAGSGKEALEILETRDIDLMITDIGMPGMTGWQLVDKVTEIFGNKILIGIMSGWGAEVEEKAKISHNINFVLSKPFKFEQLKSVIAKASEERN